ncbi:MAG: hypothetical protein KGJ89_02350 [Patescibacteria group bacterium]|nr:hypothetical protein [Patescibacteria group bacterium]MDE2015718.1 hypothetical protein [Patescibacteria group bacterium]MDE2226776.1 hypothetical protein [Patescibacteria group bacterium]
MNKITIGVFVFTICLLIAAGPSVLERVYAQTNITFPDMNQISDKLPQPLQDFINSAKQITTSVYDKGSSLSLNSVSSSDWPQSLNNWFTNTTGGVSLVSILKTVGNLFIWVLDSVSGLIKWGLSFIQ